MYSLESVSRSNIPPLPEVVFAVEVVVAFGVVVEVVAGRGVEVVDLGLVANVDVLGGAVVRGEVEAVDSP